MLSGFASTAAKGVGGAFSAINSKLKLGDVGKAAAGHVIGGISERGIDMITDAAGEVRSFERNLIRYQITTNGSAASTAAFRREVAQVSQQTGIARDQVLAGASSYVALTGDAAGAGTAMKSFARIAQASGASVEDVSTATAALRASMGLEAKDIEAVFSGMIVQGKTGAVELKDMAGQLAELAPRFALFKNAKSVEGIREMGAAFQVIRNNAGTAAGAATEFESLMGELAKNQVVAKLHAIGIEVYDAKGKMKSATEIFEQLAASQKLMGKGVLADIFGRKEAQLAVLALRDHIGEYRELKTAAEDTGAVQRDLNTYLESDAGRLDQAMNQLKLTIAEAFTPERIAKFTSAVEALVDKLGPVVDLIGKASDLMGGIYGAGQKVRGWLSGNANGNPYGGDTSPEAMQDYQTLNSAKGAWIRDPAGGYVETNSERGRALIANAKSNTASRAGYDTAVSSISGLEKNGRSTNASLFVAASQYQTGANLGANEAGRKYLRAAGYGEGTAGVDKDKVEGIIRDTMKDLGGELGKEIKTGILGSLANLNVQIDMSRDKVVDATRNSQKNFTRVK